MRHGKKFNQLGRKAAHRKSMLANMGSSLIKSEKKRIVTTLAKAKALRVFLEPLVTKAKTNTTHNRRTVFSYLRDKEAVSELFGAVALKVGDRPGGYLRILKLGPREGDAAEMALIEFVDFSEYNVDKPKKRRSRRGGSKKKSSSPKAAAPAAEPKEKEAPAEEAKSEETPAAEAPAEEAPAEEGSADSEGGEEKAE